MSWHQLLERGFTPPDDPRVGSGRDGSNGGTLSTTNANKTASLSKLGATFAPVAIYLSVCLVCFILSRPRCKRVYAPKTIPSLRYPEQPTPELPSGLFNWIKPFLNIPDTYVLNYGSLDAYFFLRYLKVLRNISLVGCCIVWPILFPIHGTGGNNLTQLELLTIGNVTAGSSKLWAHAIVAWLFFGFVLFTVVRECIYFVNLRQAYLSSPYYADRLSSKTMLLLCVPKPYRDEARLRKLYGDSAKRIFIPRTSKDLANLVKEREQTAMRLEKAEITLIKKANAARNKYHRKNSQSAGVLGQSARQGTEVSSHNDISTLDSGETAQQSNGPLEISLPGPHLGADIENQEDAGNVGGEKVVNHEEEEEIKSEDLDYLHPYGLRPNLPDVRGSVAAQWIPAEARPHHRPIGNFGRRVDTIRWTRNRLKELNLQIYKLRRQIRRGDADSLPAAFIEFDSQEAAHAAQQVVVHHLPLQMSPGLLGIRPEEVIWESLRMKWWERIIRRLLILCGITAAIIFWSIPSAFIGIVSNIDFLTKEVPFLHWVDKLPSFVKGVLGGFLPPFALSVLMALVPILLRICAAQAGIPSLVIGELFTQNAYFAFQVVQVFLVTTITSAASGALQSIIQDPLSIQSLLAQNLPKASNFYLSYILIQCLATGGTALLQVFSLIRHHIVVKTSDIPRTRFTAWRKLRPARWGGIFPVFTNMGVIALSYACIAPLILAFSAGGMAFMGLVWKYNLIYVLDTTTDSKGLFYPRALQQLIIGLYLAEICLIGLLILNQAFGPMGLVLALLIFTSLIHFLLRDAISRLMWSLPQTLTLEEQIQEEEKAKLAVSEDDGEINGNDAGGAAASYFDVEQAFGDEEAEIEEIDEEDHHVVSNRALEGASSIRMALTAWMKSAATEKVKTEVEKSGLGEILKKVFAFAKKGDGGEPPGFLVRWLHPEEHEDFVALRKLLPQEERPPIVYTDGDKYATYQPPELWTPKPTLWIPRDEARVSRQEVAHTRLSTPISDLGATLSKSGRITVDVDAAPFEEHRLLL
ncbi:hypothetical protein V8C37DRAFT_410116 [Trichoderma ceciliae]